MINFIRNLSGKPFVRKLIKYATLTALIYFVGYMFNLNYQFVNSNGLHGIIARRTMETIQANAEKAAAYDIMPTTYDYSNME